MFSLCPGASHNGSNIIGLDYDTGSLLSSCRSTCDMKFRGKQGQAFIGLVRVTAKSRRLVETTRVNMRDQCKLIDRKLVIRLEPDSGLLGRDW